jgi:methylase of polypeptide subunit release factors
VNTFSVYLCTDINPRASLCTSSTGLQNQVRITSASALSTHKSIKVLLDPLTASFASPFLDRLHHRVDILLFNPPYVPTLSSDACSAQKTADIEGSWAGGTSGMQITNQFLPFVEVRTSVKRLVWNQAKIQRTAFIVTERSILSCSCETKRHLGSSTEDVGRVWSARRGWAPHIF